MPPAAEFVVDFPTLWVMPTWIEQHCPIPDGDHKGERLELYDWQLWCTVNHYRVRPGAKVGQKAPAFHNRRSQVIAPQKTGKGPWSAAIVCGEARGPALFAGWAVGGEAYRCSDHGCGCGWVYEYEPGEPMGRPWATPLIQLMATTEDQVDNVYRPLQSMIRIGPLADQMLIREDFVRLPNDGRIDAVTPSANARLGNPVTFGLQDESGLYTVRNKLVKAAETQRRGLAGMGGRAMETSNAPDPTEDSTALRTLRSEAPDIFRFHRVPPAKLDYAKPDERRRIHAFVYAGSTHVTDHAGLDGIEAEALELMERDPSQAERFFGNRMVAGSGVAFDVDRWAELADPTVVVPDKDLIVIGVDGARFKDALAIVATDVVSGHQWPVTIIERPDGAPDDYEHDFEAADRSMLAAFDRWQVWRVYVDPQYIEVLFDRWQGKWGEKVVMPWWTHRERQMCFALANYRAAMTAGEFSHDGDSVMATHVGNATKRMTKVLDGERRPMWSVEKPGPGRLIDGAVAGCLSWEARRDAVASGAKKRASFVPRRIR